MRRSKELTVGPEKAEVAGSDNKAIQIAIDALWARGGGTVRLLPGTFQMTNAAFLRSGVSLAGSGADTVLKKSPGFEVPMKIDADYGQLKLTPRDPSGFQVGMGVAVLDQNHKAGWDVTTASIADIEDGTLYINTHLINNYRSDKEGIIQAVSSLVVGIDIEGIRIADLTIDGSGDQNPFLNGCRGGGIYLHRSKRCVISGCAVNNFNGDGVSWQVTQDITVENCELAYNKNFGAHPGTGSARSVVHNCHIHHNDRIGLFLCWRVQEGQFKNNNIHDNGEIGISIGHKDTDNLFLGNTVRLNGREGIYFRKETEANAGHRNTFRQNTIEDNGNEQHGCGIHIDGFTHDLVFENNVIRETRKGSRRTQRHAVTIGKNASCTIGENDISGHLEEPVRKES